MMPNERRLEELTTDHDVRQGKRVLRLHSRNALDEVTLTLCIERKEEISLDGDERRYEPTGNVLTNGHLADELILLAAQVNTNRLTTRIPYP